MRLAVMLGLALAFGLPNAAIVSSGDAAAGQSTIINSVGFVQGTIEGKGPYWFLVDTGANRSAFDANIARDLGVLTKGLSKVEGSAGSIDVEEARIRSLELGQAVIRNLRPTVSDLSGSLAPPGQQIAGILGGDAFASSAVLWDRAGKRVTIAAISTKLAPTRGALVIPFVLDNGIPSIIARIDDAPVKLRIDTGASLADVVATFVNVTQAFYDALRARNPALQPYTYFSGTGVGGELKMPVVKAKTLAMGRATIREPRLIVQPQLGYFARPDAVGFVGGYTLNQFRGFVIDYPHRRLILLPK